MTKPNLTPSSNPKDVQSSIRLLNQVLSPSKLFFFGLNAIVVPGQTPRLWDVSFISEQNVLTSYTATIAPTGPGAASILDTFDLSQGIDEELDEKSLATELLHGISSFGEQAIFVGCGCDSHELPVLHEIHTTSNDQVALGGLFVDVLWLHAQLQGDSQAALSAKQLHAAYGLPYQSRPLRAQDKAAMSLQLLVTQVLRFGADAVAQAIFSKRACPSGQTSSQETAAAAKPKLSARELTLAVGNRRGLHPEQICAELNVSSQALCFAHGKAIDEAMIPVDAIVDPQSQEWLDMVLPFLPQDQLQCGKLRTIMELCRAEEHPMSQEAPEHLDYAQLRVGLARHSMSWNIAKH